VLQIAPSGYRRHAAAQRNPALRCARVQRDDALMPEIQRVWHANFQVYGADKVWRQLNREAVPVARCTVERLGEAGVEPSVGSRGDSYDNALAETINGLYKTELIHKRGPWKNRESVELATLEWVSWFNHHRLLEPIGYIPPAEAEAQYYRQLANTDAANVT